jgi:thymidylate synthase (FAD)
MIPKQTEEIPVLDTIGYVRLIETWGSDERIIEAARMSTDKGFVGWGPFECQACGKGDTSLGTAKTSDGMLIRCPACKGFGVIPGDEKLLAYLYNNHHGTPFEMAGLTLEIQAPIFVFREWHRHRTQSYNELSARYTELPDMFYVPSITRLMRSAQSKTNKQGSEVGLSQFKAEAAQAMIDKAERDMRQVYQTLLLNGVAREVARMVIPVAQYSRMRASANLRNWLAFLTLRMEPTAQWEIRCYARAVATFVAKYFERTYALFNDKRTEACVTLELYRACKEFLTRAEQGILYTGASVGRIKAEIEKIDAKVEARKLA